jgi:hypothetical protein
MCNDYRLLTDAESLFADFSEIKIKIRVSQGKPNLEARDDIKITDAAPIVRTIDGAPQRPAISCSAAGAGPDRTANRSYNFRSEGREFAAGQCLIPERQIANLDERKKAITIQHLLDMTSGLDWNEESFVPAMHHSNDWTQFVLDRPMTASPGTGFLYNSGSSHLLSAIITIATGESAMSYARKRLFGPLGISDVF